MILTICRRDGRRVVDSQRVVDSRWSGVSGWTPPRVQDDAQPMDDIAQIESMPDILDPRGFANQRAMSSLLATTIQTVRKPCFSNRVFVDPKSPVVPEALLQY